MSNVHTPEFRVAFPTVFTSKRNELSGNDEYSIVALFPKGANLDKLKTAAKEALIKKFGKDQSTWPKKLKTPFRDQGDREKIKDGKATLPQGYVKGAIYLNLKSKDRPGLVDNQVQTIIDQSEFYGGCWAIATINAYAYDTAGNRGVSFGLGNIQKIRDDDHFGNRTKPEQDFKPVENTDAGDASASSEALFN